MNKYPYNVHNVDPDAWEEYPESETSIDSRELSELLYGESDSFSANDDDYTPTNYR